MASNLQPSASTGPSSTPSSNPSYSFAPSFRNLSNSSEGAQVDRLRCVPVSVPGENPSCQNIIRNHSQHKTDFNQDIVLETTRAGIWRKAKAFYKNAINIPERLLRNLVVEFEGEEGIDAGALKGDFFEEVVNEELFEGDEFRRRTEK